MLRKCVKLSFMSSTWYAEKRWLEMSSPMYIQFWILFCYVGTHLPKICWNYQTFCICRLFFKRNKGNDVETKVQSFQWEPPEEPRPKKARMVSQWFYSLFSIIAISRCFMNSYQDVWQSIWNIMLNVCAVYV